MQARGDWLLFEALASMRAQPAREKLPVVRREGAFNQRVEVPPEELLVHLGSQQALSASNHRR